MKPRDMEQKVYRKKDYDRSGCWGELTCRNCGRSGKFIEGAKLWRPVSWFRGEDELLDQLCMDCFKNPDVKQYPLFLHSKKPTNPNA